MKKTCLIIGCSGQDGSFLSRSLIQQGCTVIGTSRNTHKDHVNHKKIGINGEFEIYNLNLTNIKEVRKLIELTKPDEIYNLSAQSSVGVSFKKPFETQNSIVGSTSCLLEACRSINYCGVILFAGSSEIFGHTKKPADLNSNIDIRNPYSLAKYQTFEMVKLYRQLYNIKAVTAILFNHESPLRDDRFVTHKIINSALQCSKDKNKKFKFGNINIIRDWGWAEEYIEGMQKIVRQKNLKDQIICTGIGISLEEFISETYKQLNLNWKNHIEIDQALIRQNEVMKNIGNPNNLFKDLKWKPRIHIKDIIIKLLSSKKI